MKRISLLLLGILTFGCSNPKSSDGTNGSQPGDSITDNPLQERRVIEASIDLAKSKEKIAKNRISIPSVTGDFGEFKTFTQSLDKFDFYTISTTADYLKVFLPKANQSYRDSTYLYFLRTFYRVVNNQNDSLNIKYPNTMKKLEENKSDSETQEFKEFLNLFGVGLFMSEGMFYLDVNPDYFLTIFDKQVSKGLNDYMIQRKQELTEGFSEDAGLTISFEQVYDRVLKWEKLISENPNFMMIDDSNQYYETYMGTLLTGMDNSRIFDFENKKLTPEIKKMYESIIESGVNTKSIKIIKGYYDLLAENDFKYSDKLDDYLKKQKLSSMLGVQPDSR